MARVRQTGLAFVAFALLAGGSANAQTGQTLPEERGVFVDPTDARLFRPMIDGDPKNPNRFVKPRFGYPPAFGAGTMGFDSTNIRPKRKAQAAAQKRKEVATLAAPPVVAPVPDKTLPPYYQPPESSVARNRALARSAGAPEITGEVVRPVRKPIVEEDPFGPVGVNVGAFTLRPAIEVYAGHDSNPAHSNANIRSSGFEKAAAELQVRSNWSRHEFNADLKADYTWYNTLSNFNKPNVDLFARSRLDISSHTRAEFENRFKLLADNPSDPNLPQGVAEPPIYWQGNSTAALIHRFNRLEVSAKGLFDRTAYDEAKLNDGSVQSLKERNYDQFGGQLRASYETYPGIKPFVEVGADTRRHDQPVDNSGIMRDSDGQNYKVGSTFELTRRLTGEISVGQLRREYKDPTLPNLTAPTIDAALIYYASPLTTVKADFRTSVDESILAGVSGALNHAYNVTIDHSFRRWLVGTLKVGYLNADYEGSPRVDKTWLVSAALTYKLTRELYMKGEIRREWLNSNIPGNDYTQDVYMVGLRLQR